MRTSERPPAAAVITAAIFRGRNIGLFLGGLILPMVIGFGFFPSFALACIAYVAGIAQSNGDQKFLDQVQERRAPLLAPAGARTAIAGAAAPVALTGRYRASFDRVQKLNGELQREVAALPKGPLTDSLDEFLPQLEHVVPEVAKLLEKAQRAESEASGGQRATLEKEIADVSAKLAASQDPEVKHQLETALARKREALGHMSGAGTALERIDAQVEAIASGLQEARARLAALASETGSLDSNPAREAVEGVSRDVKYLAQAVRDTEQLLLPAGK